LNSIPQNLFDRIFNRILDLTLLVTGLLILFLLITVCVDVALRNLTGRPTVWIVEISGHVLLYLPFLAGAWVLKNEKHVKMDLLLNYMSPKSQALLNGIMYSIGSIICLAIAWFGTQVTAELLRTGQPTQGVLLVPKWPIMIIIPLGFVLLFIEFIRRAQNYLNTWKAAGKNTEPEMSQPVRMHGEH
jgi:C4-dicarboxylate transporter DctQ subunit